MVDGVEYWNGYTRCWLANFILSPMQRDRLLIVKRLCAKCSSIADVACGAIEPIITCNRVSSVAIDLSKLALKFLKRRGFKGQCVCASATTLPLRSKAFKTVLCNELIEHLTADQVKQVVDELRRIGERIVMTTPNAYLRAKIRDSTHRHFFTKQVLEEMIPRGWQIYTSRCPYDELTFYIPYKSPRFSEKKLGRLIYSLIDKAWLFPPFQKILFSLSKGAFLIVLSEKA